MRGILYSIIFLCILAPLGVGSAFAATSDGMQEACAAGDPTACKSEASSKETYVFTTEEIPGANCECENTSYRAEGASQNLSPSDLKTLTQTEGTKKNADGSYTLPGGAKLNGSCSNPLTRVYKCKVGTGLAGFQDIFRSIMKFFIYISMLLGVLAIVGFGIGWALLGGDEENTKKLKKYVINLMIGLMILFLFSNILNFLAPWVFQ